MDYSKNNYSNDHRNKRKKRFQPSNRYFTVCVYTIVTFVICLAIFKFTNNWANTKALIGDIVSLFSPFLLAFLIAYFIIPMVRAIHRILFSQSKNGSFEKLHLIVSMLIAYTILVGAIILVFIFIVPQIINSISQLVRMSPTFYQKTLDLLDELNQRFPNLDLSFLYDTVQDVMPDLFNFARTFMTDTVLPFLYNAGMSIIGWLVNILLAFVISCYIVFGKNRLLRSCKRVAYAFLPEDVCLSLFDILSNCNDIFSSFITGKAIDSTIIGFLTFFAMTFLKLEYAVMISLIVGITNMIPYFGPFIGAVPGILILLIVDFKQALIFCLLILAIQQLDGNVIGPKILGKSTGLQPISIIFAVTVGGAIAGPLGMFLGVPAVAVITYLVSQMLDFLLKKKDIEPDLSNTKEALFASIPVDKAFKKEFEEMNLDENDFTQNK